MWLQEKRSGPSASSTGLGPAQYPLSSRKRAALYDTMKNYFLKTPSTEAERQAIAHGFSHQWQFPHCLGALDSKHIQIQPPAKSGSTYLNYKGRFSVVLMAVVDARYRFIYASVGTQGRASDAGIFVHSDLRRAMDQGLLNTPLLNHCPTLTS